MTTDLPMLQDNLTRQTRATRRVLRALEGLATNQRVRVIRHVSDLLSDAQFGIQGFTASANGPTATSPEDNRVF